MPEKVQKTSVGQQKSRTEILKDAEANPIMMGKMVIENSKLKKYIGDQIHGTAKAKLDDFKQKKNLWAENDKEIQADLNKLKKVKDIEMPTTKNRKKLLARHDTSRC